MSTLQPPRLASWLLQHLAPGPHPESLLGDLIEQYRDGRSAAWYWRQTLTAILVGVTRDIRTHKLLAIRAVAVGWVLYVVSSFPVNLLSGTIRVWTVGWLVDTGHYSFGWLFWSRRLTDTLLVFTACAISGWLVARLHRSHPAAMVFLYGASVLLFEYGVIFWEFCRHGLPPASEWAARSSWTPHGVLILPVVLAVGRPLSILVGGFWAFRSDGDTPGHASFS